MKLSVYTSLCISVFVLLLGISPANALVNTLQGSSPWQHIANAPVTVAVTTTSAQLIGSNTARTGLSCTNIGSVNAYLAYGTNPAILSGGTAILAGTTWWMDNYLFTTQAINVIAPSATTLSCQEFQ